MVFYYSNRRQSKTEPMVELDNKGEDNEGEKTEATLQI